MFNPPDPPKAPDNIPIEKLVAKTAQDVKAPSKLKPLRKRTGGKFNLQRNVSPASTVGGVSGGAAGAALGIKRK